MYKVYRVSDNEFSFSVKGHSQKGPFSQLEIFLFMRDLGFEFEEIEHGIVSLLINEHQVAEYGLDRTFIFSFKLIETNAPQKNTLTLVQH